MTLEQLQEKNYSTASKIGAGRMLIDIAKYLIDTQRPDVANEILRTFSDDKDEVSNG